MKMTYLLIAILTLPALSNDRATDTIIENTKNEENSMSATEKNKKIVRKLYEQALNERDLDLLGELISEDYTGPGGKKGVAGFKGPVSALIEAFPDVQWKIEELIGEGDKVVVKSTLQGTHTNDFLHIPATGKAVSNDGMGIYYLNDGKITATDILTDRLGFLQELEVLPLDLSLLPNLKAGKDHIHLIDRFIVPVEAKEEFLERVKISRSFIRELPGFIDDMAYEGMNEEGDLIFLTFAVWENEEALKKAKKAVQAEYKKQGFDPAAMFERLNISMERSVYKEAVP